MKTKSSPNSEQGSAANDLPSRFLKAALELETLGRKHGFRVLATYDRQLPLFRAMPHDSQKRAVEVLEKSRDVYKLMSGKELDVRDPSTVIWQALNRMELVPPRDFFDKIGGEDVVQIFSPEGYHLFANFKFFEFCSYTLEQIYSLPWPSLWQRDDAAQAKLIAAVGRVLGHEDQTILLADDPHLVRELASPFKLKMTYNARALAPLRQKNVAQKVGFMIIERARLLNAPSPSDEEHMLNEFLKNSKNHGPESD